MIRRALTFVLGILLRVFFRRIEVEGAERVPPAPRPAIFVLNHPNGLVDPLFILCLAPREVSFLAKSTIFKMPVLGALARGLDSLPVYRHQDAGEDPARNAETFEAARALVARGGTIALFPEGTSHSAPELKPLKTGAARLALGARARLDALSVIPAGLYYSAKRRFRSDALVCYGPPIDVPAVALDECGEPPRDAVRDLTARIEEALRALTLNADRHEALALAARAERIFSSDPAEALRRSLARELDLRRRFVEGHAFLVERDAGALEALVRRVEAYERRLEAAGGLDPATLAPRGTPAATLMRVAAGGLAFALAAPVALAGALLHLPAYRLCGVLARRFSNDEDDMVATVKMLAALLLFPLTWAACAATAWLLAPEGRGPVAAAAAVALAPYTGWVAVRAQELLGRASAAARALLVAVARPRFHAALVAERAAIRGEMMRLAEAIERERGAEAPAASARAEAPASAGAETPASAGAPAASAEAPAVARGGERIS